MKFIWRKWTEDDELLEIARERGTTTYHPMGSCRMGPKTDITAVVDHNLKVYGIENLRVVDASIMPTMLSANIHAGAYDDCRKSIRSNIRFSFKNLIIIYSFVFNFVLCITKTKIIGINSVNKVTEINI